MNRLIIITGDLATGKSTLADNLSLSLNIPCFKKDVIKEKYCDEDGYSTREENRQLSLRAVNYMIDTFTRFASLKQDLILEANFRSGEMNTIKDIAEKEKIDVTCIVLRGDMELIYDRFMKRLPTRHPAHKSIGLDRGIEYFAAYVNEQRKEEIPFIPHIIDVTNKDEKEVLQLALSFIK